MADNTPSRLINQAQFRRLGNHFEYYYLKRDTKELKTAIQDLQHELDYINDKFNVKAMEEAQDNTGMDRSEMNGTISQFGRVPNKQFRDAMDVLYGRKKVQSNDGDDTEDKGAPDDTSQDASPADDSDNDSDEDSHHDKKNNGHDNDASDKDDDSNESKSDLDFLNNMNK